MINGDGDIHIDGAIVTGVLLADGWHDVVGGSFSFSKAWAQGETIPAVDDDGGTRRLDTALGLWFAFDELIRTPATPGVPRIDAARRVVGPARSIQALRF